MTEEEEYVEYLKLVEKLKSYGFKDVFYDTYSLKLPCESIFVSGISIVVCFVPTNEYIELTSVIDGAETNLWREWGTPTLDRVKKMYRGITGKKLKVTGQ